ncbi:hypothetical protein E2C01_013730 [Portunus trituberculatus]|uniref:Uncharacterized protein n=1 Tax=Portunus trituberculatus TaxID=210409 RepID=A0A5B7DI51_PORTR|nr:hypothetical protein [Portunus trituberculatus]
MVCIGVAVLGKSDTTSRLSPDVVSMERALTLFMGISVIVWAVVVVVVVHVVYVAMFGRISTGQCCIHVY